MNDDLVERLRSKDPLPVCPFDRRSPDYWTAGENGAPCTVCGGTEEVDKCRGADTRIMDEAADALTAQDQRLAELEDALSVDYALVRAAQKYEALAVGRAKDAEAKAAELTKERDDAQQAARAQSVVENRERIRADKAAGKLADAEDRYDVQFKAAADAIAVAEAAEASLSRLKAAVVGVLEPFGEIAEHLAGLADDHVVTCDASWAIAFGNDGVMWEQLVGQFRNAAALLSSISGGEGKGFRRYVCFYCAQHEADEFFFRCPNCGADQDDLP